MTYSSSTFKYTITAGNAFRLDWSFNGDLARLLGWAAVDTASAATQTSTQSVNLSYPLCLNISIRELDGIVYTSDNKLSSTFIAVLREGSGFVNYYEPQTTYAVDVKHVPLQRMHIRLTDLENTTVDINNVDWAMSFTLTTGK